MKYVASIVVATLLISNTSTVFATEISKKDQKSIVGVHNVYRNTLKLQKLEWSDNLAQSAQNWATILENNECPLAHSPAELRNDYGENLYAGWSTSPGYRISIKNGAYAWGKEKSNYRYATNSCAANQACGHYTQMVWQGTRHVGCAVARCQAPEKTTEILVCHYDPPGNNVGELPY